MIDWNFIGAREGRKLRGYVPDASGSMSGVTIATGCDLGAMSAATLASFAPDLQALLRPYLGLHGAAAVAKLQALPLTVSDDQANAIDAKTFGITLAAASTQFDRDAGAGQWAALPDRAQTVIASVTFQYGTPWVRCPRFWAAAVAKNWRQVVAELRNFGDAYQPRHTLEADYLALLVT